MGARFRSILVVTVILIVVIAFIFAAYPFGWSAIGFLNKSLWDWLHLPILPLVLAVVTLLFQLANTRNERQIAQLRNKQDQQITLDILKEVLLKLDFDRNSKLLFKVETNDLTNPHRSRQATHKTTLQQQANDDKEVWKAHWKAKGQSWRTEPEIEPKQKKCLAERRSSGIYPFKGIKLSRAEVEWLLATHENGRGPVDWNDESQRERDGLDLRGANLHGVNLSGLPLARLQGGLTGSIWNTSISELDEMIPDVLELAIRMKKTIEEAIDLGEAELKETDLRGANLEGANLTGADLEGAALGEAELEGAFLFRTRLKKASLHGTNLESATLYGAQLNGVDFNYAQLERATLTGADLKGADLSFANLKKANLSRVRLKNACLMMAQLEDAILEDAQLEGASLPGAYLERVDLTRAQLDKTDLTDVVLNDKQGNGPCLADIQWGNTNITLVDWTSVKILGDEHFAYQSKNVDHYKAAVRAYRQLAVVLRDLGLNEDAARFAFRAQRMQRKVFWYQRKFGQYFFSGFLNLLAGYGYRFWRILAAYLLVIIAFAITYFIIGHKLGPVLSPLGSVVFSMTSFHGRGFFPGSNITLDDPLTVFAAFEAFIGLLIEVTFIATLTQRLFGK